MEVSERIKAVITVIAKDQSSAIADELGRAYADAKTFESEVTILVDTVEKAARAMEENLRAARLEAYESALQMVLTQDPISLRASLRGKIGELKSIESTAADGVAVAQLVESGIDENRAKNLVALGREMAWDL